MPDTLAKILIVEDEAIVAFNLQQRLQHLGYRVIGLADSSDQALTLIAQERPDLILMDIHIRGLMDGIDLACVIARERDIPIVYLTAYAEDATLARARATRPHGYLIKPFSERELHATLQMALERHAAQVALADSQRLLAQALQAARMGVVEIDTAAQTVRVHGEAAQVLGVESDQPHGLPTVMERLPSADRAALREDLARGGHGHRVVRLSTPDGAERWLQFDLARVDADRVRGIARDVTEREQARLAVARLDEELHARVDERTQALREQVRDLETFSHTAAHDLRSPVRAISGLSEILRETHGEVLGDEGREMLERMAQSARRMGELIEALLRLTKLSRTSLNRREVDLSAMARDIAEQLRAAQPERDAVFTIADGLTTTGDPALLHSVLDNLLRNAWKFSAARQPARITVDREDRQGRTVFRVSDNGCGFDMAHAGHLFNAFFRLHGDHAYSGSGLGLNIVQRIVLRHGGQIWAEGQPEQGATFLFTLGGGAAPPPP